MSRSVCIKSEFIAKVKNALKHRNLSQKALADHLLFCRSTVNKFCNGKAVDRSKAQEICFRLELDLEEITGYSHPIPGIKRRVDWGKAIDTSDLSAREEELNVLEQRIVEDNCRVVLIEGMQGMGKTNLSYRLGKQIQQHFDFIIWRSLDDYASSEELFADLLEFFTAGEPGEESLVSDEESWRTLTSYLKKYRCLLIFPNTDFFLQDYALHQRYGKFVKWMIEEQGKSCLIITSDIEPKEIVQLRGNKFLHCIKIEPLIVSEIKKIFNDIGIFSGSSEDWIALQETYSGNPFVLKNIAVNIHQSFGGNITNFINFAEVVFNGVEKFLDLQIGYLSKEEETLMYWLAIYRHPINLFELNDIVSSFSRDRLLSTVKNLRLRFFVESDGESILVQPPMIQEFFVKRLINQITEEIIDERLSLLDAFPLLIAAKKRTVQKDQEKFILKPIIVRLRNELGTDRHVETCLRKILSQHQNLMNQATGYANGNIVNLLTQLDIISFNGHNLSNLVIRNADFRDVNLHNVDFYKSDLSDSIFLNSFSNVLSVAFSPDGQFLAIGDTNDNIYIWKLTEGKLILKHIFTSHNYWVRTVVFSPDSKVIASGGEDGTIYLRAIETGKELVNFDGHIDRVRSVAFSSNGQLLASGGDDKTVRIWDLTRNELIHVLIEHQDKVRSVVFHPVDNVLISLSQDNKICLWAISSQSVRLKKSFKLQENGKNITRTLAISPDGKILASGSDDGVVRFWNPETGAFIKNLEHRHTNWIRSIAFSPKGDQLASAGEDRLIYLWNAITGECLHTLRGHTGRVWSVAFHPFESWLASGDDRLKVKLWHTETSECLRGFKGYSQETRPITFSPDGENLATGNNYSIVDLKNSSTGETKSFLRTYSGNIWSLAFSPDAHRLVGGSDDTMIRIWDLLQPKKPPETLKGHGNWVRTVACSRNGKLVASGSDDKTVRLWDAYDSKCLHTFTGHTDWVRAVFFHPKNSVLASGSDDGTVKLWDLDSYKLIGTLKANQHQIWTISIHPEKDILASGSNDNTINIWDLQEQRLLMTLKEHRNWISSLAFSADGRWLASGSYDSTIRLWELSSDQYICRKILQGHGKAVISVSFHPKQPRLVSTSKDGSIKLWDIETGDVLDTWRSLRPYEGLNITEVTGITSTQKLCLKALGAVECKSPF